MVVRDAQFEIREVGDDIHPVAAHTGAGVTLLLECLVDLLNGEHPVFILKGLLGLEIVFVPGIGGGRLGDQEQGSTDQK